MKSSLLHKDKILGFWGYIPPDMISEHKKMYPDASFVDLDVNIDAPEVKIIPESSCMIIKNILNNSFFLQNKLIKILAPVGKDKCDNAFFISKILKEKGFNVAEFEYSDTVKKNEPEICTSNLPLREKVELITANIIEKKNVKLGKCKAKFGFWGTPPNDLSILELFPDETHVFGWLRCTEVGTPSDIALEMQVEPNLPTIFYAQTFCSKCTIAKYLANKYNGLFIDADCVSNNSIKAKIEAFLTLR